jgi:hypothetical protein
MDKNMKRLLGLVRAGCASWPGLKRDLESALEIGHGRLEECLNGTRELRVCHVVNLARLLKVKPSDFFRLAYADDEASAPNQLEDWIGEPKTAPRSQETPAARSGTRGTDARADPRGTGEGEGVAGFARSDRVSSPPKAALVSGSRLSALDSGHRLWIVAICLGWRLYALNSGFTPWMAGIRAGKRLSVPEQEYTPQKRTIRPRTGISLSANVE